jgi:hypothetical protein
MSLNNTLNTNEVKDAAAAEVEFGRLSTSDRKTTFAKLSETPNAPYRLSISHAESGTGASLRRRSVVRFDKTVVGVSTQPRVVSAYIVLDAPTGDLSATTEVKNVIANLLSFCATTGAATTVLFDCTGLGADVLVQGGL